VAAGFMAGIKPFSGKLPQEYEKLHLPAAAMWVPPLLLGILSFAFGIFPGVLGDYLISSSTGMVNGGAVDVHLKVWHGFNTVLYLSVATLVAGTILYLANR